MSTETKSECLGVVDVEVERATCGKDHIIQTSEVCLEVGRRYELEDGTTVTAMREKDGVYWLLGNWREFSNMRLERPYNRSGIFCGCDGLAPGARVVREHLLGPSSPLLELAKICILWSDGSIRSHDERGAEFLMGLMKSISPNVLDAARGVLDSAGSKL
jgi:hypothetical protein